MENKTGTLYVVGTPIGNLGDISPRAIDILRHVDFVVCEDTRVTGSLLRRFEISKEMFVSEDSREKAVAPVILERLKSGLDAAVVSDAGTRGISDPGFRIVRACRLEGVPVVPIPGACAFVAALSASGLPSDSFLFAGFLQPKSSVRKNFFKSHADFPHTIIFYESPYRIEKFIDDALEILGPDRIVCVAKEISKIHERFFVGSLKDVKHSLGLSSIKGEFVVLVAPADFKL